MMISDKSTEAISNASVCNEEPYLFIYNHASSNTAPQGEDEIRQASL
jgi:hypothetical protein